MTKQAQPQSTDFAVAEATKDNSTKLLQSVIAADTAPLTPAEMAKAIAGLQQQAHGAAALDDPDTAAKDCVMGETPCQPDAAGNTDQAPQERGALPTTTADTLAMIRRQAQTGVTPDTAESTDGTAAPDALPTINVDDLTGPIWESDPLGRLLNGFAPRKPIQTWAKIGDRLALPRRGVIQIDAKLKEGKSLSTYALAVALLGDAESFANLTPMGDRPKCILIADTEMDDDTLQDRWTGVYNTIGDAATQRLAILPLLNDQKADRWNIMQKYVQIYNPEIVVFDNLTNMVANVNDQDTADEAVDKLAKMGADRTIIAVIHQNKSKEDTNATGALGTRLGNCAVERYTAKRQNGVFYLMPIFARRTVVPDDDAARKMMALTYSVTTDPQDAYKTGQFIDGRTMAERVAEEAAADKAAKWRQQFATIFAAADADALRRVDMVKRLMAKFGYCESAADAAVTNATSAGVLVKDDKNPSRPLYKLA